MGHDQFDDPDVWARIIAGNVKAIAKRLCEDRVIVLTRDYILENGEVIYALGIEDGLAS